MTIALWPKTLSPKSIVFIHLELNFMEFLSTINHQSWDFPELGDADVTPYLGFSPRPRFVTGDLMVLSSCFWAASRVQLIALWSLGIGLRLASAWSSFTVAIQRTAGHASALADTDRRNRAGHSGSHRHHRPSPPALMVATICPSGNALPELIYNVWMVPLSVGIKIFTRAAC